MGPGRARRAAPALFRRDRVARVADDARLLDGRVFEHRTTGEVRVAVWTEAGIEFFNPKTRQVFVREHRKALQWCQNADDITPRPAPLPPEIPALPCAEEAVGGAS